MTGAAHPYVNHGGGAGVNGGTAINNQGHINNNLLRPPLMGMGHSNGAMVTTTHATQATIISPPTKLVNTGTIHKQQQQPSQSSVSSSTAHASHSSTTSPSAGKIVCANCETRETPLWRRGLNGEHLCNGISICSNL